MNDPKKKREFQKQNGLTVDICNFQMFLTRHTWLGATFFRILLDLELSTTVIGRKLPEIGLRQIIHEIVWLFHVQIHPLAVAL